MSRKALDPATRTVLTEIDLSNADNVELSIPRGTPSLIVPAGAIVFDADGLHALVVENGIVHSRKITEVRDLGTEVEVSRGVKPGDEVVLTPPVDLKDNSKVQIRAPTTTQTAAP
jgi:hypothetical protein